LEGYAFAILMLMALAMFFVTVPYLIMTLVQGNPLGWVNSNKLCTVFIAMMLVISIGARHFQDFWGSYPIFAVAIVVAFIIGIGEFLRS